MHRLKSYAILLALIGLFAGVAYAVFGWTGAFLILGLGLAINGIGRSAAARMILRFHRARPVHRWEAPQLWDAAERLASRAGISKPQLAVYPSDLPNAFALGLSRTQGVISVSSGLLRLLSHREVEGVLAHELAHLKNRDSRLSLSAGLFVQAIGILSNAFGFLMLLLFLSGAWITVGAGLLPLAFLAATAPYAAYALQAALMRTRERLADRDAALLTGDPRALASALQKLEQYGRYLRGLYRRFRFIYTAEAETGPAWLRTHPTTEDRVQNLLDIEAKALPHPTSLSHHPARYILVG